MSRKDRKIVRRDIKLSEGQISEVIFQPKLYPEHHTKVTSPRFYFVFTLSSFLLCAFSVASVALDYAKDPQTAHNTIYRTQVSREWSTGKASALTLAVVICFLSFDFLVWEISQTYWYLRKGTGSTAFLLVTIQDTGRTRYWIRLVYIILCMAQFGFLLPSIILGAIDHNIVVVVLSGIAYVIIRISIECVRFKYLGLSLRQRKDSDMTVSSLPLSV